MRRTTFWICLNSVVSVRMNLRRAGVLKNSSFTSTVVPGRWATGAAVSDWSEPSPCTRQPDSSSGVRELSCRRDTEAILGSASPRNPRLLTCSRSVSEVILLVACRDRASDNSSCSIPLPSSRTRIRCRPPCSGRALDDFTGGNLVNKLCGQNLDRHGSETAG